MAFFALFNLSSILAADRFGDISVTPQNTLSGITRHGYFEHQILVANESSRKSHEVTLVYPSSSVSPPGFYLGSMKRSLTIEPNSTVLFKMWQPPFPTLDKQYAVYVDGDYEGVAASGAYNDHGRGHPGLSRAREAHSILTSRNINSEQLRNLLTDLAGASFSASKATGAPNASLNPAEAWKPAPRRGVAEWLELDFVPPLPAQQAVIYEIEQPAVVETLQLISAGGNVLLETRAISRSNHLPLQGEARFPLTSEPVARVKLICFPYVSGTIKGIDAVELIGPDQQAWAAKARASSSLSTPAFATGPRAPGHLPVRPFPQFEIIRSELDSAQWSDQWISYTPFGTVLITARDYESMPEPARGALWGYIHCGGRLAVFGRIPIPSPWKNYGQRESNTEIYPVGFGLCQLSEIAGLDQADPDQLQSFSRLINPTVRFFEEPGHASRDLPPDPFLVVEDVRIPFRGLAMILLGFATVAGPLNLWLLSRYKRKIWSLWTVPAISLFTCGLVSIYSIMGEGITPHLRVEGVTLLDQREHHAATLGIAGYYCPLTPKGGLFLDYHTALQWITDGPGLRDRKLVDIDWTQGQHLHRGWIAPRVPAYFQVRKFQTRRERIHLEQDEQGQLKVVNGLGAPVISLRLTLSDGRSFTATNLPPGQRSPLQPFDSALHEADSMEVSGSPLGSFGPLQTLQRMSFFAPSESVWAKFKDWKLPPGTYLALLEDAPFLEEGLRGKAFRKKAQVIVGLMDSSEAAP